MTLAHPLQWPLGWKRTAYRVGSPFRVSLAKARDDLYDELERLGASQVIVSSNAKLNLNGTVAAKQGWVSDPGVAVNTVWRWERGELGIRHPVMLALARPCPRHDDDDDARQRD